MNAEEKVRENRVRRMANRQGYRLMKSRRRDPRAWDYGTYCLLDYRNILVLGNGNQGGYGCSLDEIEGFLLKDDDQ